MYLFLTTANCKATQTDVRQQATEESQTDSFCNNGKWFVNIWPHITEIMKWDFQLYTDG